MVAKAAFTAEMTQNLRQRALDDFYVFTKGVLGFNWLVPHIHGPLCKLLQDSRTQRESRIKIVIPRGWLKTTVASIAYPIWRACHNVNVRCLLVQNTHTNAIAKNQAIKGIIEGEDQSLFKILFPEIRPGNPWKGESLCIDRTKSWAEGTFEAAGTRTKVTSRHYDIIIQDDTVAPDLDDLGENALIPSKGDIEQAIGYHRLVTPLLTDPKEQMIVVGTRWFERDLLSWMGEHEPYYTEYTRACREDADGKPDHQGKITYPERFDESTLAKLKIAVGPYSFNCLYMNTPVHTADMIFDGEWIQYYDSEPRDLLTYTTVDPGGDPADTVGEPDFSVVMTCGKDIHTGRVYLLDYWRAKSSPGALIESIFDHVKKWKPLKVGFESVSQAKTFLYFIREKMQQDDMYFNLEGLHPGKKAKPDRIRGLVPVFAAKHIYLRPHMQELVSELLAFPLAPHDDLCDTLAMQLPMWAETVGQKELGQMNPEDDPLSLIDALERIRGRDKVPDGSVYDIYNAEQILVGV